MSSTINQTYSNPVFEAPRQTRQFGGSIAREIMGVLDTVLLWQQRANDRAHLRTMNDHLLADMGISPADARRESAKPFWQA